MYCKKSTMSASQNLNKKLIMKDSMYSSCQQIQSQPQSSKGMGNEKVDSNMRKKLHNILGHKPTEFNFKLSPKSNIKQEYFVSAGSLVESKSKHGNSKQNHTENNEYKRGSKKVPMKFIKPNKVKESRKIYEFLENNYCEIQKQFGNFVKSVDKIQLEPKISQIHQNTERSTLIALFERLNAKDHEGKLIQRHTHQESELFSQKHSLDDLQVSPQLRYHKLKKTHSNSSSGVLNCGSYQNPNSSSTQVQHQMTSLISIEQKSQSQSDDILQAVKDRSMRILKEYQEKLRQSEIDKQMLIQEVQYWKSRYYKSTKHA